jgi:uncharacterized protein DUF1631
MSRKLRTLLKNNRRLEEKIFYEPRRNDWRMDLISPQELSNALTCLANKIIENQSPELSVLKMLNDVDFLTGRPLAAFEKNALQVVEILFNYLRINTEFDRKFYHILNSLQLAFTRLAQDDLSFLDNPKHPAVTFLEQLISIGYHFDENAGRLTRYLVHAIELLVDRLASKHKMTAKTFSQAHKRLDEYLQSFEEKANLTKNKLLAEIEIKSRKIQADFYTSHLIKSKIEGDEIPIFLLDFFENQLCHILHDVILKYGTQSKQCQQLLTDMDTISWSIGCSLDDPDYRTRFDADVNSTMKRLYSQFQKAELLNEYVKAFFLEIEELHRNKLDGKRVQFDVMISADIFAEDFDDVEIPTSWEEKQKDEFDINSLKEGRWYNLDIEGVIVRSNLLMINELTEKIYFVNLSGEPLLTIGFEEQGYLADNLAVFILDEEIRYQQAINALERELTSKLEVLNKEYQTFKQQEIIDEKQRQQMEERAKMAVLARLEEEKKKADKVRLQQQEAKRRELNKIIALEKIEAEKRFKAKGVLRKLGPGSKVVILIKPGRWMEASLMIISRTTKRYIFADASGNKIVEPTKAELVELINDQEIKVISSDNSALDPLQSLVMRRREKLSQGI